MQRSGNANPELQLQAEKYVGAGYQRLLTFEATNGGFSLFGAAPADIFLSAYGLMEFNDMAKVYPVDKAVIKRTAQWLLAQQQPDGAWHTRDARAGQGALGATSYVAWALVEAGYQDSPQVEKAIAYIREMAPQEQDAYNLALAANALAAYAPDNPTTQAVLDQLYALRAAQGDGQCWQTNEGSFMGAWGKSGRLETTALTVYALLRANVHLDAASAGLTCLVQGKDEQGTWGTTQATILSLKALLLAHERGGQTGGVTTVRVSLNQTQTQQIVIDKANADLVHQFAFERGFLPAGHNQVEIELEGSGNLMYQVSTRYYLPWKQVTPEAEDLIAIDIAYDRTQLFVNDEVAVDVNVQLKRDGLVKMALIDLGLPPGFDVQTDDLTRLVEQGIVARYELTGRQIILYVEDMSSEAPLRFSYRLQARFPLRAQTPPSSAYDYYNPADVSVRPPQPLIVQGRP